MFAFLLPVSAHTVFSDDFSSGGFNAWASTYANPTISSGIAAFTVYGGDGAMCYAEKNQLAISANEVFSVSSRVSFNTIPTNGEGNSMIVFNAIVDSSHPEDATVYAFVDGSRHFGLWIGQWPNYVTAYDTEIVQADTYYNVTVQLDNANQQLKLIINGVTKITRDYTAYSQFQNSNQITIYEGIAANYALTTVQVKLDYVVVSAETFYTVSASAGFGGSISPSGQIQVVAGGNQTFTISANTGYLISQVTVDGQNQGAISSYTFTNVQTSHTIAASFIRNDTQTAGPLHVAGSQIRTANNTVIVLRGVDYTYFIDGPNGSWMTQDGSILWNTWNTAAVNSNLDALQSWGVNHVRVLATVQWWIDNTNNFQSHLSYFITQAAQRGIYVDFTFWRTTPSAGMPDGVLPWADGNGLINNSSDFVNLWINVADILKDYPNVLFEFWNEPNAGGDPTAEASWFNTTQQCINALRGIGVANLIVVQWDYGLAMDYQWYQQGSLWGLDWVDEHPLSDSAGNLVYSTHIYRSKFYNWNTADGLPHSLADVTLALTETGVIGFDKPLLIGEIGCSLWAANMTNEYQWYNNTLTLLNQNGIGYDAWAWAPWRTGTQWGLVTGGANYQANQAGQIFQDHV
jgi:hypothetical protein